MAGIRGEALDGAGVDDAAPCCAQMRKRGLDHKEGGRQIDEKRFLPVFKLHLFSGSFLHYPGIIDKDIQPARLLDDRVDDVWDNSAMESFFSSMKTERTARKVYRTRDAARAEVFDYIERLYNPRRRHSKLGYLSPMAFEDRAMQT